MFSGFGFSLTGYDKRGGLQFYVHEYGLETSDGACSLSNVDHAIYNLINLERCMPYDPRWPMR